VPLAAAAAAIAYMLRPPPQELKESGQVFEDEATGFLFHTPEEGTGECCVVLFYISVSICVMLSCNHHQLQWVQSRFI
jgi:hypothetical protein